MLSTNVSVAQNSIERLVLTAANVNHYDSARLGQPLSSDGKFD